MYKKEDEQKIKEIVKDNDIEVKGFYTI